MGSTNGKCIAFVVNCLDIGGAEIQVMRLATGMIRRGWSVAVVSLLAPGPLAAPLESCGAQVYTLSMRPSVPNSLAIFRLRRILRRIQPHIVHSHIVHANLVTRLTRLVAPMPVLVCTAHNLRESGPFLERCNRYTDALADLTTNVSQAAVDRYIRVGAGVPGRIRFVPNGLEPSSFVADSAIRARLRKELSLEDRFVWLAVGRFREQKDYPNLLRAFATVATHDPASDAALVIAGSGPTESHAMSLASSLNIGDRVRFLGIRDDIAAVMSMADAFVLSSAWEGMPLVLQEAGASALPIVATDVGGNREAALDGISAFLVAPHDPDRLANAMRRMASLPPDQRQKMGHAGRDHVISNYSIEKVLDRWQAIYAELSQDHQPFDSLATIEQPIA
jgi:glycosyltransferase involved in cell wall biosynthesis